MEFEKSDYAEIRYADGSPLPDHRCDIGSGIKDGTLRYFPLDVETEEPLTRKGFKTINGAVRAGRRVMQERAHAQG